MLERIMDAAVHQLTKVGPGDLSMRSIARDMGVSVGALYRHVADRDAVLTLLIMRAYDGLGDAIDTAVAEQPAGAHLRRWTAIWRTAREWSLARPHEFSLIYGSPVIGFHAPEETIGPATRIIGALGSVALDSWLSAEGPELAGDVSINPADLGRIRTWIGGQYGLSDHAEVIPEAMIVGILRSWTELIGMIGFELFGHYRNSVEDPGTFLASVALSHARALGIADTS